MDVNVDFIQAMKTTKHGEKHLPALFTFLDWDVNDFEVFSVVGTNGKGSVAYGLAQQLAQHYKQVGLFLSPAFLTHNERIRINNVLIADEDLWACSKQYQNLWEQYRLTFFERWLFIMVWYFMKYNVTVVVIEAGIGGISDATSCLSNQKAVIVTSIGYDHTKLLGETIGEIIANKIQICHQQTTPVFLASDNKKYRQYFTQYDYRFVWSKCGTTRTHDINMCLVATVCQHFHISVDKNLLHQKLLGRGTILRKNPLLMIDGAHNISAMQALIQSTRSMQNVKYVVGFAKHKDIKAMISYLQVSKVDFLCTTFQHRATWKQASYAHVKWVSTWEDFTKCDYPVIFCGSLYFVPLVYDYVRKEMTKTCCI